MFKGKYNISGILVDVAVKFAQKSVVDGIIQKGALETLQTVREGGYWCGLAVQAVCGSWCGLAGWLAGLLSVCQ